MKIRFIGAAQEVTGSKHLITTESGKNILLDCGMFQGKGMDTDQKNRDLSFDARKIDYVILSHAHIDHSGLIPYLYKKGFRGSVICTAATRDLCSIMLEDSAHIQELDVTWYNKKQAKRHQPPIKPLYTQTHARKCMELFIAVAYNRRFYINDEISVKFTDSGHMLGSAVANLRIKENGRTVNIAYTGDIGRHKNRLLRAPEAFPQCDYLICESTYGDRLHPDDTDAEKNLYDIVADTCIRRHGKLIIPSFSIGRTQEIVYVLNKYYNAGQLPESLKVYVDSPLAVNATEIFRLHLDQMNKDVQRVLRTDSNPFGF
ncbi:MAG: MBL fold metallo-hydrolase, partial [Paludibacteraceae bacterium]|nr:MBL fold metallo-hydrolase [Paludibacteraceae bacterium]